MKSITDLINLKEGEDDRVKTLENITKNISFKGATLWILACAILIASVGLNVNSPAVIIGAMLISPLMGPIVGAGFALGIYDFTLLQKSLKNLLNATVVSLVVSTLYFFVSPFKDVQSELLARTAPNIYDILIAFFGGLVGAIAITRTEKGNPIPGVAIATALMPPLCTAGYGLATAQWTFFFGAFYLYCINCVFIGIATFAIVKYLKYPAKKQVDKRQEKQVKIIITLLIGAMLIPGSYLAYRLYNEQQFKKHAERFIEDEFVKKGYTVVYKKTEYNAVPKKLELAFLSKRFDKEEIKGLNASIDTLPYLKGTRVIIRQDSTDRLNALRGDILNEIKSNDNEVNAKDLKIIQLEKEIAKNTFDSKQLLKESRALYPEINALSVSKNNIALHRDSTATVTAVIYGSSKALSKDESGKFKNWLQQRLGEKRIELFRKE